MIKITLIRQSTNNATKAVTGLMTFPIFERDGSLGQREVPTLENADYLIPEGIYKVERTWSPKFKKFLPELIDVPDRCGIRIHRGSLPEHSRGCILLSMVGMSYLDILFNQLDVYESDEEVFIDISSAG